jgi:hypothetical protein
MNQKSTNLLRGISVGMLSGMIWGVVVLVISSFTQLFVFDFSVLNGIFVFIVGGTGFGLLLGAFLEVLKGKLPFQGIIAKSITLSVVIWLLFFAGGLLFHILKPNRYHLEGSQHLQGFFLSIILGLIFGVFWNFFEKDGRTILNTHKY